MGPVISVPAPGPVDVVLRDGSTVSVRSAEPGDARAVERFLARLSTESRWLRYFTGGVDIERAAADAVDGPTGHRALLALTGHDARVVGVGQVDPVGQRTAEVAFAVADELQGRGLGTILLAHVAELARAAGIEVLQACVLPSNTTMRAVFRDSGFPFREHREDGVVVLEAPAALSPRVLERFAERERVATVNAVARVLRPSSVAVVGASRRPEAIGSRVLANLLAGGYRGELHVVSRHGEALQGCRTVKALASIGRSVDLVVVAVPAPHVLGVARDAARVGAGALVVISAGFAEAGERGRERQQELVATCREAGIRLVGPNCLGVVGTAEDVRLNATFGTGMPPRGGVGLMSQSGALGIALLQQAEELGIGISSFVSAGNKSDLSANDFLQYWESDPDTSLVLLYLESFGNPRDFARIARRVGRSKPIVAIKSGRSAVGAHAAASHTGALLQASDVTVDALFRHAGVVRADSLQEFLGVAALLERQPVPAGRRVAVITNAGGPAILCADACVAEGLELPEPPRAARRALRAVLPDAATVANPIDMLAAADADDYGRMVRTVARGGWADAIVAIFIEAGGGRRADVEAAIVRALDGVDGPPPLLAVMMSPRAPQAPRAPLPTYRFPEEAARVLARATEYGRWRAAPVAAPPAFADARREDAAALLADAAADGPRWLDPVEVDALCACWGLPMVSSDVVPDADAAAAVATRLGGPAVLKAVAPGLLHRSDAGAVQVGLANAEQVGAAAVAMGERLAAMGVGVTGFLVQPMLEPGVELLVGVVQDDRFGPVVACGAGGTRAELERDVAVRLAPIGPAEAAEALRSLRTFPLLDGWRGAPKADLAALQDVVLRTAAMADAHPQIRELDFNPVLARPDGAVVLDARVRVAPAPAEQLWPAVGVAPPRAGVDRS